MTGYDIYAQAAAMIERGEERQKVIALLRGPIDGVIEEACLVAAAMIERGEHRPWKDE